MPRPKNPDALTPAERSAAWRARRRAEGGLETNIHLSPENAAKALRMAGKRHSTVTGLINALIAETDE